MVSFGEKCALNCKFCYTFSSDFENYPKRNIYEIVKSLKEFPDQSYKTIYVSCDMESFINQSRATELIENLSTLNRSIHFTTRMNLTEATIGRLKKVNDYLMEKNLMLIPAISVSSFQNSIYFEPPPTPSPLERIETIKILHKNNFKVILALRPFLPIVNLNEYKEILDYTAEYVECILGGVFYFDQEGILENRLGIKISDYEISSLDFIENSKLWKIYKGTREKDFIEQYCKQLNKNFFMSSTPAINWIKSKYGKK